MAELIAELFRSDPRVSQAKKLVREALSEHGKLIRGIRPPNPLLKKSYDDTLRAFGEMRGGALFYPYLSAGMGNGPLVELADGSVKYDFISGIGVHYWGHSHPAITEAAFDAAMGDTVMHGNLQQDLESVRMAEILLSAANESGAALEHCFFSTSGAMANENALKMIFQKKAPANRLLAFSGCFAGRTIALSSVTDRPAYRTGVPNALSVDYVPFFDSENPEESTRRSVDHLKRLLDRYPGGHAAMIFELVQGEGGFFPGSRDFFTALFEVLGERDIAIMIDEIQTFGRTERLFAFQHWGLDKYVDIVTVGKMTQVCATLFREEFRPKPGLISQTFTSSAAAIAAGRVIVTGLLGGGFFGPDGKIARLHIHFRERLEAIEQRHPELITGPFGIGAMIAFTPLSGDQEKVKRFVHALFDAGVIAFYCGHEKARARFLPPAGAVTFEQIDEVMEIVERTLLEVASGS
jgi:4-aminobutyrate aminotransferase-like enzyme